MKTRFAPSPTGQMHLGNVRTALFNALLACHQNGQLLLRIEDTDQKRSRPELTQLIQKDLQWLGIHWKEGPYFQSQRQAIYNKHYDQLSQKGKVYPCFCSDEQLALARKIQLSAGQPPRYAGTCRHLNEEQIQTKLKQGDKPTLRFHVPTGQEIHFVDLVKGPQRFRTDDIGDFIIRRGDGSASFFFCNAIDDAEMGVTHSLRGEDHLTNTPRQILILQALELSVPHYGHLALIVGDDGSPLSKRHGSRSLQELREQGYLPNAINNYLGRLGHFYEIASLMTIDALAAHFSLAHLGKTPAHFDAQQLLYWQKMAVAQLSDDAFWAWLGESVQDKIPIEKREDFVRLIKPNTVFPEDANHWANILFGDIIFDSEALTILNKAGPSFLLTFMRDIDDIGLDYPKLLQNLKQQLGLQGKALFQPLRVALTGQLHGPELAGICMLMDQKNLMGRLQNLL